MNPVHFAIILRLKPKNFKGLAEILLFGWLLVLAQWPSFGANAVVPPNTFEQANKLYEEGKYAQAAKAYESLIQSGEASEAIYFNLGNALFKGNQIGRAIINYRLAERLNPRDPDVRANLQFARNSANGGNAEMLNLWERGIGHFTLNEWTLATTLSAWLLICLFVLILWRPGLKQSLKGGMVALILAAAISFVCLATAWHDQYGTETAVVTVTEAVVRYGPLDESQSFYTARDGEEMKVLDIRNDWLQVEDAKSRAGWLKQAQVALLNQKR